MDLKEEIVKEIDIDLADEDIFEEENLDNESEVGIRNTDERENAIEWYTGHDTITVTLTQRRLVNSVKKYAEKYPDEVQIVKINDDGTILAHIPLSYLRLRRPVEISEERRQKMREQAYKNMEEGKFFIKSHKNS